MLLEALEMRAEVLASPAQQPLPAQITPVLLPLQLTAYAVLVMVPFVPVLCIVTPPSSLLAVRAFRDLEPVKTAPVLLSVNMG
jgi:hypothetical protein